MCRQRAGCNAGTLTARSLVEAAARDVQAKGQAATLDRQRLTARLGGSCRAHLKPARKSSTPAVVPGAAPALAKAGVGGYTHLYIHHIYIYKKANQLDFFRRHHRLTLIVETTSTQPVCHAMGRGRSVIFVVAAVPKLRRLMVGSGLLLPFIWRFPKMG